MHQDWVSVLDWHRVVNELDLDGARQVMTEDVVVGGPKGQASGVDIFVDWIEHAGIRLAPMSWHPIDESRIVVEQDATWPNNPEADPNAAPIRLATLFEIRDGRVASALRFDTLHEALTAAS